MKPSVAVFFGGPEDGGTRILLDADLSAGFVDTYDSLGTSTRYSIVALPEPKQVGDIVAGYELRPAEGVW